MHGMMSICDKAVAVLDGTHCPIQRPDELDFTYFSGYKHKHSQNYLVCVDYMGMIIYVSEPFPGRMNDREAYNQSHLGQNISQYLSEGEVILADGGFIGGEGLLVPTHETVINKMQNEETKATMIQINEEFTSNRIVVEDVFGWVKERACILNSKWERHRDKQVEVFNAVCRLHNFLRLLRIDYAVKRAAAEQKHTE
jgi:hypothetical protein